jgi:hypothetical protein
MIGYSSESSCIRTMCISKHVTDHKLLENVHKNSLQIQSQISQFLCNRPYEHLKVSGRPAMSSKLRWHRSDNRATPSER